ncbi:hypothetical protein NMY22_g4630 [Coprinellus aureogranulatus]|nr:hypothetical protein NMY22_g4630 [Coprinellus aureogranulatus]
MVNERKRCPVTFFDDEELNWAAWHEGKTDSDLEREADEFNEYADAMEGCWEDDWDEPDLPTDIRDLPPGFPPSLLEEPYRAPLSAEFCMSLFERMAERREARATESQGATDSSGPNIVHLSDPEAEGDNEASDDEPQQPESSPPLASSTAAAGPDRYVRSTKKKRIEQNSVQKKRPSVRAPTSTSG